MLVLNAGSSSLKFASVDAATGVRGLSGLAENLGTPDAVVHVTQGADKRTHRPEDTSLAGALLVAVDALRTTSASIGAVGHRVVHGGPSFTHSVVIDDAALDTLRGVVDLAPLHVPAAIAGIEAARQVFPDLAQVAVFDTAFHQTMPARAYRYAVPEPWFTELGVRRYGFHGTSHRYVSAAAADFLSRPLEDLRLVTAHLGNGCSAAALLRGKSVDTTMGMTPLEGLVMGTRSGDVDASIVDYVAGRLEMSAADVVRALNKESGLLGVSGLSNDVRELTAAADAGSERARLALELFCYRLAKHIAGLVVPLGGLDALVFTGGIGENSAAVRSAVLGLLGFLGLVEDPEANAVRSRTARRISPVDAGVAAVVVPTDEELVIARDAAALTGKGSAR